MPALTIKNIPDDVYNALKDKAKQQHRSINSEVITCLKRALLPKRISPEERLSTIRAIRSQVKSGTITVEDIDQVINEGRP
jgi:plasmid stability protein